MDYLNIKNHLQELLDNISADTFVVSHSRDMVGKSNKVNVIFTPLAGTVRTNSATIPYKLDIFTPDADRTIKIFTQIAQVRNGKSFISMVDDGEEIKEYTIFEYYSTPAVTEEQLDYGTNRLLHIICYFNINVVFEVGNVSKVVIDGEEIDFETGTLGYTAEFFSNRTTGVSLNKGVKKAATTNLQLSMVNKVGIFTNKVFQIMFGKLEGSTKFSVQVTLTNGFVGTLNMSLQQNAFNFAKRTPNLPSFNIVLINA